MIKRATKILSLLLLVLSVNLSGCQQAEQVEQQESKKNIIDVEVKSVLPIQQTNSNSWLMLLELSETLAGNDNQTFYHGVVVEVKDGINTHRYEDVKAYRNAGGRLAVILSFENLYPGSYLNNGTYYLTVKSGEFQSEEGDTYQLLTDYEMKHIGNNIWGEVDSVKTVEKTQGKEVTIDGVMATYQEEEARWYFELYLSETVLGQKYATFYDGLRVIISNGEESKEYALGKLIANSTDVMTGPSGSMTVLIYPQHILPNEQSLQVGGKWTITFEQGVLTSDVGNLNIQSDYTLIYNGKNWIPQ